MMNGVAGWIARWAAPHVPEASDGILTSAGICEGFAGAGVRGQRGVRGRSRDPLAMVITYIAGLVLYP